MSEAPMSLRTRREAGMSRAIQRILGGRPMMFCCFAFMDVVRGTPVYIWRDTYERFWMAGSRWGWFRVRSTYGAEAGMTLAAKLRAKGSLGIQCLQKECGFGKVIRGEDLIDYDALAAEALAHFRDALKKEKIADIIFEELQSTRMSRHYAEPYDRTKALKMADVLLGLLDAAGT